MTRVGWVILGIILLVVAAFASTLSIGTVEPGVRPRARTVGEVVQGLRDRANGVLVVPVAGVPRSAVVDSWGDARGGGARAHHGTDIMAAGGTPVLAAAPGRIEKLFASRLGGTTLYVRSPDGGWVYYYAHLAGYARGLREGMAVRAGQPVGYVGDTGDAGPGNYHLHFGLQRMNPGERWWQGRDVNPYPLLASGRRPG